MGEAMAGRVLEIIRGMEVASYRFHDAAVPLCLNVISSLSMGIGELRDLHRGDVILLENSDAVRDNERQLWGMAPYVIFVQQEGNQMTVLRSKRGDCGETGDDAVRI
jgi:hypothetical protein